MKKLLLVVVAVLFVVACEPHEKAWWVQQERTITDEQLHDFCNKAAVSLEAAGSIATKAGGMVTQADA